MYGGSSVTLQTQQMRHKGGEYELISRHRVAHIHCTNTRNKGPTRTINFLVQLVARHISIPPSCCCQLAARLLLSSHFLAFSLLAAFCGEIVRHVCERSAQ